MSLFENSDSLVTHLVDQAGRLTMEQMFASLANDYPGKVCFSTSFSKEDQLITEVIARLELDIKIFTLDTGRLFQETYSVWSATREKYQQPVVSYNPQSEALQEFISIKGPNAFYESVDNRKSCCHIRKVEPLRRALAGNKVWITGLRGEHSADRNSMPAVEWDNANQQIKYHPLLNWGQNQIDEHIAARNIPYNPLHDRGFVSIGCAPCTRAIMPGEDFRAGRWWWENKTDKECGLHTHKHITNQTPQDADTENEIR